LQRSDQDLDTVLASVLAGRVPANLADLTPAEIDRLFERACFHGIAAIEFEELKAGGNLAEPVVARFRQEAMSRAMWELRHRSLLLRLTTEMRENGVEPVCFKGTALAYSLYDKPHHRSRCDSDLLVPPQALAATRAALLKLGFHRQTSLPGESVHAQENWLWRGREGQVHAIDLHWRINNARALGELFTYDELHRTAERCPQLGGLLVTDHITSLVIAAFHRAVHQFEQYTLATGSQHSGERLCWLYDIHLLANALSAADWSRVFALARSKGVEATLIQSLRLAEAQFGTVIPDRCSSDIEEGAADRYLQRPPLQRELSEVFGWGLRRALQRFVDVACPPANYVRSRYASAHWRWLPWLYVRRWMEGIAKRVALLRARP
jgi:hypothetical protein